MKKLLIFIITIVFMISCRKDHQLSALHKVYDTIWPRSYYPVYPGSTWKYLVNDSEIVEYASAPTFMKHNYIISDITNYNNGITTHTITYSDTVLVPYYKGSPVYGYDQIVCNKPPYFPLRCYKSPILSETTGDHFTGAWTDTRYGDFNTYYSVMGKTQKSNGDSVLTIRGRHVYGPSARTLETLQYIKNIGLAFRCDVDSLTKDTLYKFRLVEYHINK